MPYLHHAAWGLSQSVFLTLALVLTEVIYLRGWRSFRSDRARNISPLRAVSFLVGLCLLWVAVASPIAALDHELLTVHMLQHLLLMTLAPPLIWLGTPVGPISHGLPRRFVKSLASLWQLRATKKFTEILGRPKFAWLAACAALVGWHIPKVFALGMQSVGWHLFEHLSFLITGLLFWRPVVQPSAVESRRDLSMILYLFFATLPCDILSGFLVFCDRVVYSMYFSSSHLFGFSPLVDQQCAAALMWTCVTVVYFVAGSIFTIRLLSPQSLSQVAFVHSKLSATGISQSVSQSLEAN